MRSVLITLVLVSSASGQKPIGQVQTSDATVTGSVVLANGGATVMSGSQISAGDHNARIMLERGGLLQVCSQSAVTITSSATGKEHLIALNKGSIETHYELGSAADSIVTPDFRIQLPGPGAFHVAVSTTTSGDTCIQSLPGDSAAVIVNEVFGDGIHQLRPGESVLFHGGSVADPRKPDGICGCGLSQPDPLKTVTADPGNLGFPEEQSREAERAAAAGKPIAQPPSSFPAGNSTQPQMQVDAPMVFRADDAPPPAPAAPKSAPAPDRSPVQTAAVQPPAVPAATAAEPAAPQVKAAIPAKPQKRGFFQRLGSAIASFFHGKK